jgi:hypothetical protein
VTPARPLVRILGPDDAAALLAIRREALVSAPWSFGASPEDDRFASVDAVRGALSDTAHAAVFGADTGGDLAGMVGLFRPASPRCTSA